MLQWIDNEFWIASNKLRRRKENRRKECGLWLWIIYMALLLGLEKREKNNKATWKSRCYVLLTFRKIFKVVDIQSIKLIENQLSSTTSSTLLLLLLFFLPQFIFLYPKLYSCIVRYRNVGIFQKENKAMTWFQWRKGVQRNECLHNHLKFLTIGRALSFLVATAPFWLAFLFCSLFLFKSNKRTWIIYNCCNIM